MSDLRAHLRPPTRPAGKSYLWQRAVVGNVSTTALALAFVLHSRMDPDGSIPARFSPSTETLSREMGYAANSRRAVARALRELQDKGFLEVVSGRGRKVVNRYQATLPETMSAAEAPQQDPDAVADEHAACGPLTTHPSPSNSNSQPTPTGRKVVAAADREAVRDAATSLLHRVLAGLPTDEAEAVFAGVAKLKQRKQLAVLLYELVEAGHADAAVSELTAPMGSLATPYQGCTDPARAFWSRASKLHARLVEVQS